MPQHTHIKPTPVKPGTIRPATVRNRILWVLGTHGVEGQTAESIFHSLTTGNDPMPEGIPESFRFEGVELVWPMGVATRPLSPRERKQLNLALSHISVEVLDSEDNARAGRHAYTVLWNRTQQHGYVDPTSARAQVATLLQEATGCDETCERMSERGVHTCSATCLCHTEKLDGVLCGHRKPKGRLTCTLDNHHEGLHTAGKSTWTDTEVVKIQAHITDKQTVTEQGKKRAPAKVRDGVLVDNLYGVGVNGGPGLTAEQVRVHELNNLMTELNSI